MSKFNQPGEGIDELRVEFNYWSGVLETRSVQLAYGLIAANWVVHEKSGVLSSDGALLSLLTIVIFLAVQLFMSRRMAEFHRSRVNFARDNHKVWQEEFENRDATEWPYTREIEDYGDKIRKVRLFLPSLSGALFVAGIVEAHFV